MRLMLLLLTLIFTTGVFGNPQCELKQTMGKNNYYDCYFPEQDKHVSFLDLHGSMKETAFAHGTFLAHQISDGALKGVMEKRDRLLHELGPSELKQYQMISKCVFRNYKSSVSDDFIEMSYAMADALKKQGVTEFSRKDVLEANMMVELSIFFDGLEYLMETNPGKAKRKLLAACPITITGQVLNGIFKKVTGIFKELKFGCTGISASGSYTSHGGLLLSRNFDTGLLGKFEKYPLVMMHHPKKGNAYVGFGSAGLHFPGGISGFNEKGLAVSLHELQTTKYRTSYSKPDALDEDSFMPQAPATDIAPYMLNKLLMEASTMDEAIQFIKARGHFGAWSVFIGDAKSGEIASVEFVGNKVRVARRTKQGAMAQSNHFFHKDILKYAFEYSYNKSLETRSRFNHVTESLNRDKGSIDAQWMIDMLSGHIDHLVGKRSFGRTTTKVYTSQSHVMNATDKQAWFSLGEVYPTTSSTFVGFQFNFHNAQRPFIFLGSTKAQSKELEETPSWSASLGHYVNAYLLSHRHDIDGILNELDQAVELALQDDIIEVPYHHIRGRYLIKKAQQIYKEAPSLAIDLLERAFSDYQMIIDASENGQKIHPYQLSLAYMWSGRTLQLLSTLGVETVQSFERFEKAKELMGLLPNIYPSHHAFSKLQHESIIPYTWDRAKEEGILMGTIE